ncbi:prolyl oligopeptidase [Angomonas deanei]|nr:prolyl oligopeptidase [Angomonas deanei]|eukprot:EPY27269.1 prolyl oligopeptidase [Angomonas deanei]
MPEFPLYSLSAEMSDCHKYLIVNINDGCEPSNLVWVSALPASVEELKKGELHFEKLINEFVGEYSFLGNDDELFYFSSTRDAPKKKVITLNIKTGEEAVLVEEQSSVLSYAALAKQTLLLIYLEDVKDVFYYRRLSETTMRKLDIPIGSVVSLFSKRNKNFVSFKISSFLLPGRSYTFDVEDPEKTLAIFSDDTVAGLDADNFVTEQRFYQSADGTSIPMFIVYKKGCLSPTSPVLLYGYGGFNISLTPSFSPSRIVFLNNLNGVLAVPNIRGGGEYGQAWHDAGRRENKQNCFTDFIEAARFLHKNDIGSPATTAIMGGSNGGLLVAACANQAPEEFSTVVCQVGVLDMYKFHKFTIGHAWVSDYGNPDKEEDFLVQQKYSPIHNVKEGVKYPGILVVTGDHDDRVGPLHSLKSWRR